MKGQKSSKDSICSTDMNLKTAPSDDELPAISPTNSELINEGVHMAPMRIPYSPKEKTATQVPFLNPEVCAVRNLDTGEEFDLRESDVISMLNRSLSLGYEAAVERALWYGSANGDAKQIKKLLKIYEADMTYINHGMTAIHVASARGYTKTVEVFLDYGKNVDLEFQAKYGQTALHLACTANHFLTIQLLVRSGANINAQDINGDTPLHILVQSWDAKTVAWFAHRQPNLYIKNYIDLMAVQMTTHKKTRYVLQSLMIPEQDKLGPSDFSITSVIGKGSFGKVYLVENLGQQYAMKVLDKDKIFERDLIKYVMSEKNVLCQINHPFIVRLHHSFQNGTNLFLIMDYCSGGDLSFHLKREKSFQEPKARAYLAEIVLALEELHSHDIIYRDLKPDNIVLDGNGHVMLTDFGLSKQGIKNHRHTYSFCGSVAYLPPEILNKQGHGKAVDWYLAGTLLYEMLVGYPPYYAKSKDAIFSNIRSAPLPFPHTMGKQAKNLISQLMIRDPAQRLADPERIKSHRFFQGINWDDVYNRRVQMPKTCKIRYAIATFDSYDSFEQGDGARVNGWSFNSKFVNK